MPVFNYSPYTILTVGDTIRFSNCSEDADTYQGDFGDGSSSSDIFPQHINKGLCFIYCKIVSIKI